MEYTLPEFAIGLIEENYAVDTVEVDPHVAAFLQPGERVILHYPSAELPSLLTSYGNLIFADGDVVIQEWETERKSELSPRVQYILYNILSRAPDEYQFVQWAKKLIGLYN